MAEKTIFKRIIDREIPASIIYEDEFCLAFHDVSPQAPIHFLVIPKQETASTDTLEDTDAPMIGHIYLVIRDLARKLGIADGGYRVVSNCGPNACQTVPHLHFHVIGGRQFGWPPG